jgi:hypothetical protein
MKDGEKNMAYTRGSTSNIIVGAAALFVTNLNSYLEATNVPAFVAGESYKETLALRYSGTAPVQDSGFNTTGTSVPSFRNVGYTQNGVELSFQPDFGEVMVDQLLDVAKMFKQGMKVTLKTSFAEATLENLLLAIAGRNADLVTTGTETYGLSQLTVGLSVPSLSAQTTAGVNFATGVGAATVITTGITVPTNAPKTLNITSGELGDYPIERGLIAVGPGLYSKDGQEGAGASLATVNDQAERVYMAYRAISIDNVTVEVKRDSASVFEVSFRLLPDDNGVYGKIVDRTY